jgi:hypothetical protein
MNIDNTSVFAAFLYAGIGLTAAVLIACLKVWSAVKADRKDSESLRRHVQGVQ